MMILQVPVPPVPPTPPFDPFMSDWAPPIFMAIIIAAVIILWPLMRALGRRLEGKGGGGDPALRSDVEHLHTRLSEVDALQARVAELEERVDFTERLLAQTREPDRLQR
jgi:hypothetical protein